VAFALFPLPVRAAPCGAPNFISAFPPDGAKAVPMNATLSARYAATAEYNDEPILLARSGAATESLTGSFDSAEGLLSATPADPLLEGAHYTVTWPALHGVGVSERGSSAKVSFTASGITDTLAPEFDGLSGIEWDVDRERDECTDSLEDRFAFDLSLENASDDGGRASLALVVYQTEGPKISAHDPPVQVLLAPIPARDQPARVERSIDDASGSVCFAALVRDLTGAASGGAEKNVCTTTVPPPFFYGCNVSPGRTGTSRSALALLATSLVVRRIRRPRRSP
jgi:hypothetical protein